MSLEAGNRFAAGRATSGNSLDGVHGDMRPEDLEQTWHDVHLHIELLELPDELKRSVVGLARESDHNSLDVMLAHDLGQALWRSEQFDVQQILPSFLRAASTKPSSLMPYSACWSSLRPTSCPTSPAPTTTTFCT